VATAGGVIVEISPAPGASTSSPPTSTVAALALLPQQRRWHVHRANVRAGLDDQLGGLNLVQTDYNNDGCKDILVLRGGWELPQRNSLLRNDCDGTFTDVTAASGLAEPATALADRGVGAMSTTTACSICSSATKIEPVQLFLNKAGSAFEDISRRRYRSSRGSPRVSARRTTTTMASWISTSRTSRGRTFCIGTIATTRSPSSARSGLGAGPGNGFATWFFDYDNDGWLDLFATSYFTSVDESVRTYLGLAH
jgi:hypothetical protein